ncbi:hypothetical protein ACOSP7_003321 [Xanthoceras sorbifolium]
MSPTSPSFDKLEAHFCFIHFQMESKLQHTTTTTQPIKGNDNKKKNLLTQLPLEIEVEDRDKSEAITGMGKKGKIKKIKFLKMVMEDGVLHRADGGLIGDK